MASKRSPILGFNHNIRYRGRVFHVQTEDSGVDNPHVFSHMFHGGVIISSRKLEYDGEAAKAVVKSLMQTQHKSLLRELKRGDYDEKIVQYLGPHPIDPAAVEAPAAEAPAAEAPAAATSAEAGVVAAEIPDVESMTPEQIIAGGDGIPVSESAQMEAVLLEGMAALAAEDAAAIKAARVAVAAQTAKETAAAQTSAEAQAALEVAEELAADDDSSRLPPALIVDEPPAPEERGDVTGAFDTLQGIKVAQQAPRPPSEIPDDRSMPVEIYSPPPVSDAPRQEPGPLPVSTSYVQRGGRREAPLSNSGEFQALNPPEITVHERDTEELQRSQVPAPGPGVIHDLPTQPVERAAAEPGVADRERRRPTRPPPRRTKPPPSGVVVSRPAVIIGAPPQVVGGGARGGRPSQGQAAATPPPTPRGDRPPAVTRRRVAREEQSPKSLFGQDLISEKSLDEVILAYLSEGRERGVMPAEVKIYTAGRCWFCRAAKELLEDKGIDYTEIDVTGDHETRADLAQRTGRRTVPNIFVNGTSIGGYDELNALEHGGELDALLAD